ncbi:hypothetical protein [Bacteroides sp. MSB163]|uniref:hypothetical protein n=1 Tax=Bacteroides maternus TaxID=3117552 RepID=UPI002ED89AE9
MKALSVITLLTLLSISCAHEAKNQSSPNSTSDTITPAFLKQEEAALLLQKEDEHIRRWSSFDLASHTVGIEGGKQGYLQFAGAQTRNWNDEETALLMKSSQFINQIIREKELKLPFPEKVRLIKSTIKEEGGAGGYTRDTTSYLSTGCWNIPNMRPNCWHMKHSTSLPETIRISVRRCTVSSVLIFFQRK